MTKRDMASLVAGEAAEGMAEWSIGGRGGVRQGEVS